MTLYQVPALGLSPILNRRSKVAFTSAPVSVLPLENLIPAPTLPVQVLPPLFASGIDCARSGPILVPSVPPAPLKPTRPSWVRITSCHSCSVELTCGSGEPDGAAGA